MRGCGLPGQAAAGPARISGCQEPAASGDAAAARSSREYKVKPAESMSRLASCPGNALPRRSGRSPSSAARVPGTAQELIDVGEQADQPGEAVLACPCAVIGAVH